MRKRSKYRPYRTDRSAWAHAIGMQQQLTDAQLTDLGMAVHTSIERMRTGNGIELDWHTLAAAVNVSLVLCERGVGAEYLDEVKTAQDALLHILERHRAPAAGRSTAPPMSRSLARSNYMRRCWPASRATVRGRR